LRIGIIRARIKRMANEQTESVEFTFVPMPEIPQAEIDAINGAMYRAAWATGWIEHDLVSPSPFSSQSEQGKHTNNANGRE